MLLKIPLVHWECCKFLLHVTCLEGATLVKMASMAASVKEGVFLLWIPEGRWEHLCYLRLPLLRHNVEAHHCFLSLEEIHMSCNVTHIISIHSDNKSNISSYGKPLYYFGFSRNFNAAYLIIISRRKMHDSAV